MIDNFKPIRELLYFRSEDDFYHLSLIQRKKDCSWLGSNSRVVKEYFINSLEYFDKIESEVKAICEATNSRASIRLNRRSYRKTAFAAMQVLSDKIMNLSYETVKSTYSTACGRSHNETKKVWIVDIDEKDEYVVERIAEIIGEIKGSPIITVLPTLNGFHILTNPFNTKIFATKVKDIDLHKDNPTLLYFKPKLA